MTNPWQAPDDGEMQYLVETSAERGLEVTRADRLEGDEWLVQARTRQP